MQCCTFINCLLLEMAFELKHGAICGNGAITAVVTKEDNDAFSSRADDVFSKLQTRLEATAVPLPSSDEDDEDLHPLCGAKVSNPKKTVLHQHHMVCVFLNMLTLLQFIVPIQLQVDLSVSKHRDTRCSRNLTIPLRARSSLVPLRRSPSAVKKRSDLPHPTQTTMAALPRQQTTAPLGTQEWSPGGTTGEVLVSSNRTKAARMCFVM